MKHEQAQSRIIEIKEDEEKGIKRQYINDPTKILEKHTETWAKQWEAGNEILHKKVVEAIKGAIQRTRALDESADINGSAPTPLKRFSPQHIREAAKRFKNTHSHRSRPLGII